jgi:hypothetical protein
MIQVAGVDQEYICRSGVSIPMQAHWVVQDAHDAHQTDQDEVGSALGHDPGQWS